MTAAEPDKASSASRSRIVLVDAQASKPTNPQPRSMGWVTKAAKNQRSSLKLKQQVTPIVENPFRVSKEQEPQTQPAASTILVSDCTHADLGIDLQILGETESQLDPLANLAIKQPVSSQNTPTASSTLVVSQPTTEVVNPFLVGSPAAATINAGSPAAKPANDVDLAAAFELVLNAEQEDQSCSENRLCQFVEETAELAKVPCSEASCSESEELAGFHQKAGESLILASPAQPENDRLSMLPAVESIDISALADSMHETSRSYVGTIQASSQEETPSFLVDETIEGSPETTTQFAEAELSFAPSTLGDQQQYATQTAQIEAIGQTVEGEQYYYEGAPIYESTGVSNCQQLFSPKLDMTIMHELNVDLRARRGEKDKLPEDLAITERGTLQAAPQIGTGCRRYYSGNVMLWAAPKFHHQPLYFEQPMLERYGHYVHGNCVQSVISAAHFFGSIPLLPYKIGANHPLSCDYTLGHWRPGNCNPRTRFIPEVSTRGLVNQSLFVTGTVFFVP